MKLRHPGSHQKVADELNLKMDDPFTRVVIATFYWYDVAQYLKQQLKLAEAKNHGQG